MPVGVYEHKKGLTASHWKGGKTTHGDYIWVKRNDHPRANKRGYIAEHVLVAEKALGHVLPNNAVVHHVNTDPHDNRSANLVICQDQAYHLLLHRRLRAYKATGNAKAVRCWICGSWETDSALLVGGKYSYRHKRCHAENEKMRQAVKQLRSRNELGDKDERVESNAR